MLFLNSRHRAEVSSDLEQMGRLWRSPRSSILSPQASEGKVGQGRWEKGKINNGEERENG